MALININNYNFEYTLQSEWQMKRNHIIDLTGYGQDTGVVY